MRITVSDARVALARSAQRNQAHDELSIAQVAADELAERCVLLEAENATLKEQLAQYLKPAPSGGEGT